jgi:hypothetical protein
VEKQKRKEKKNCKMEGKRKIIKKNRIFPHPRDCTRHKNGFIGQNAVILIRGNK